MKKKQAKQKNILSIEDKKQERAKKQWLEKRSMSKYGEERNREG